MKVSIPVRVLRQAKKQVTARLISDIKRGKIKPVKERNFEEQIEFENLREAYHKEIMQLENIERLAISLGYPPLVVKE